MNGIIYYTKIRDEYSGKNMEHMIGGKASGDWAGKRIWPETCL